MHDADVLRARYVERQPELTQVARDLTVETEGILENLSHIDRISYRVKGVDRFVKKACRRPSLGGYQEPLREVEDQVAGRILVFFRGDLEPVMNAICKEFSSVELRRKEPRTTEFGYESDHSIFVIPPQVRPHAWRDNPTTPATFELQVRTLFQHAWAEPQHDLGYKSKSSLSEESERELAWAAASAWGADQAFQRVAERMLPRSVAGPGEIG
jgi:putative GTP pyrophosphokinase